MEWSETIKEYVQTLKPIHSTHDIAYRILHLLDCTRLQEGDTEASMATFCEKVKQLPGNVAAVCVFPQFARLVAAEFLNTPIKVATTINFPEGTSPLESVLIEISRALQDGVQELDVVFPYYRYLAGERQYAHTFVAACRAAAGEAVTLKVILETGALNDPAIIADACYDVLTSGADFVKTSTGKIREGATLEAAATLLLVIRHLTPQLERPLGLKVSGGIRTLAQAADYIQLADQIMGRDWVTPETFRIGASQLIDEVLKAITH